MTTYVYDHPPVAAPRVFTSMATMCIRCQGRSLPFGSMGNTGIPTLQLALQHFR